MVKAVLETLRDRMSPEESAELRAHLPPDLQWLISGTGRGEGEMNGTRGFLKDVGDRLGGSLKGDLLEAVRTVVTILEGRFRREELKRLNVLQNAIFELGHTGL